ncbi:MAG TPA: P27 family phage terminase small subunit [Salinimicrobium sp.]|nr:P27 family phage terminase small subunit [Salinimicrobium sp.]
MKIVHTGKETELLSEVPKAGTYLGSKAKNHFKRLAKILIASNRLKRIHVPALEILAVNAEQWEWALREIRDKNKDKPGSGYIQKYASGANNISAELSVKRDAEKAIMQCIKQFGLDPKSEKDLKATIDPAQTDLFEEFQNRKNVQ